MDTSSHMNDLRDFILGGNQEQEDFSGADGMLDPNDIDGLDFSNLKGPFKKNLYLVKKNVLKKKAKKIKVKPKTKSKIVLPNNKEVIVGNVDKLILNNNSQVDAIKNISYYKGEKLKELVLTFNNTTGVDFEIALFDPSMPLDFLYSTSLNLNDMVQVGGGGVSYSDVLFNILANPALLVNAKFVFSGNNYENQRNEPLRFKNKNIMGETVVDPIQTGLFVDTMQFQGDIVFFNLRDSLNRFYIPDGMDIINYRIRAGMTVTLAFFYKQKFIKDLLFEESRVSSDTKFLH